MKVSIIIVTYNRLNYLKQAIESVKDQTYKDIELLVLNNGCTDGTKDYLSKLQGITYYENIVNDHSCMKMNQMIDRTTGDIVFNLCDDDYLHNKNVISQVVKKFIDNPMLEVFYGSAQLFRDAYICDYQPAQGVNVARAWGTEYINWGTLFYRKSIFKRIGYLNTDLIYFNDGEFKIRCLMECCCYGEDIPVINYRIHGGQETAKLTLDMRHKENRMMYDSLNQRYRSIFK